MHLHISFSTGPHPPITHSPKGGVGEHVPEISPSTESNLNSNLLLKCLYIMSYWIVFPKLLQFQLLNFFSDFNVKCFTFNKIS